MLTALLFAVVLQAPDCPDTRLPEFPGVVIVSTFAYDRGCGPSHFTVDGKKHEGFSNILPALKKGGWDKKDKRAALAVAWLLGVSGPDYPEGYQGKLLPDGSVRVDGKYKPAPGMREVPDDYRVAVHTLISADGKVSPIREDEKPNAPIPNDERH